MKFMKFETSNLMLYFAFVTFLQNFLTTCFFLLSLVPVPNFKSKCSEAATERCS